MTVKRIIVLMLSVFCSVNFAAAQSGRQIKPAPTPIPAAVADTQERQVDYSESAPNPARRVYAARENKNKSKDKNQANSQTQPAAVPPADTSASGGDDEVLKIETNLITIPVSVYDRNGLYIPDLRQSDFKIYEDGAEQEIAYFGTSDKPFTVILLIDVSPSTEFKIEEIQAAATAFVDQLKPADNVMVIEFDSSVHVLAELTNDRQKIYKAIGKADFGSGTSLYNAVDFSLRKQLGKIEGRKAIVLFTDGVDTTSRKNSYEGTIAEAEEADAMIFPIYFNTYLAGRGIGTGGVMQTPPTLGLPYPGMGGVAGTSIEEYRLGRAYLEELAAATGGRVFRPESTPGGLTAAFEGIAEELRRQYNIGYYPQNPGEIGQRKQIKVRVNRPRMAVRARDSYIVGGNTQAQTTK